jgi:TatD DNase family protein
MSIPLIDTHAHLDFAQFDADRENVILRAQEANVIGIINVGTDLKTSQKSIAIAEVHENIFAAVGIHPHDAAEAGESDIETLRTFLDHPKVVAIGEVGLDFYRHLSPPDVQRRIFRMFLDWALETAKPLIIHTREAEEEILAILQNRSKFGWNGVFHCFPGDERLAAKVLEMGFHISFTGTITFKNSRSTEVMKLVPLERLLVETDCPFMAPVPHRGKRNEPAFAQLVAQKIAEVKGVPFDQVAKNTTENAERLFGFNLELKESDLHE